VNFLKLFFDMSDLQRIIGAIKYLKKNDFIEKQQDLVAKLGYNKTYISGILNGKSELSSKFIEAFCACFPVINMEWLLTGEGEMLKKSVEKPEPEEITFVPLLPISAQGGSLNDFMVSIKETDCEKIISPIKGADFAITVSGDSMSPEYPSGSQVLVKKINEKAFIDWGKTYVLDTCNGSVIKILVPSEKEGYVKCLSINPDPKYAPFDVSFDDINGIYRVMLCMSMK
jgi:phage repressor protein C with HTH and peptisase S24 domain